LGALLPLANGNETVLKIEATVCRMEAVKILLSLVVALGFWNAMVCLGEDAGPQTEKVTPMGNAKTWAGMSLNGLILDLQDDKRVLWFQFNREGYVAYTVGRKGGPVTAPAGYWKVNGEWMQIFDDPADTKPWFQMRLLNRTKKMIRAENGAGEKQIFAIKK
jgi:hypothetical protein